MASTEQIRQLTELLALLESQRDILGDIVIPTINEVEKKLTTLTSEATFDQKGQQVTQQLNIQELTIGSASQPSVSHDTLYRSYLTWTRSQNENLPLRGRDAREGNPNLVHRQRPKLTRLYVSLNTKNMVLRAEHEPDRIDVWSDLPGWGGQASIEEALPLSALSAVVGNNNVLLLGSPGSGKSTFLRHLTLCLVSAQLEGVDNWVGHLPNWPLEQWTIFPIRIRLRDFVRWLPKSVREGNIDTFWQYMEYFLRGPGLEELLPRMKESIYSGHAILALDGLDEVYSKEQREITIQTVQQLAQACSSKLLVTSRTLSYSHQQWEDSDFFVTELAPFTEAQIDEYIHSWHQSAVDTGVVLEQDAYELELKLKEAVRRPDLWEMASNPLLLSNMSFVHTNEGFLSNSRAQLYQDCVELLLWNWEELKLYSDEPAGIRSLLRSVGLSDIDFLIGLRKVAFDLHKFAATSNISDPTISSSELIEELRRLHPSHDNGAAWTWAERVMRAIQERAGLLIEQETGKYSFPHDTFREYLAGCHLSQSGDFAVVSAQLLLAESDAWHEVVFLAVGQLAQVAGNVDKCLALINELLSAEHTPSTELKRLVLAARLLVEIGPRYKSSALGRELAERVRIKLVHSVETGDMHVKERTVVGEVLSQLGDTRFSSSIFYLPDRFRGAEEQLLGFVRVEAGPFLMYEGTENEHEVDLDEFFVARYPVTEGQYWQFISETNSRSPLHWRNSRPNPCHLNHPVVNISWYEANLYCHWLTKNVVPKAQNNDRFKTLLTLTDGVFRLPTEAQWEKAAKAGERNALYPWGSECDVAKMNVKETGIGCRTAVGLFPEGVNTLKLLDMAGNVWEWCSTRHSNEDNERYPLEYDASDGREDLSRNDKVRRVLRGGAFHLTSECSQVHYRIRNFPFDRHPYMGFRLVLLPR